MCFREEPFEPLDEEDYDDPTVQMELCDNSVDNSGNAVWMERKQIVIIFVNYMEQRVRQFKIGTIKKLIELSNTFWIENKYTLMLH